MVWEYNKGLLTLNTFLKKEFSVRLLSVLRGHSVFSSPPQRPMTSDFEEFNNVMDKIWDRKSFEVGGHWPVWRG